MIDERREAQASLYVLGALPVEEAREFEHALRADLQLQFFVSQLRAASGALALAFPRVDPPPALKQRVLAAIEQRHAAAAAVVAPPAWLPWVPWALAACFAVLCVVLLTFGQSLRRQSFTLHDQLQQAQEQLADLEVQNGVLAAGFNLRASNLIQQVSVMQTQLVQRAEETKRQRQGLEQQVQQSAAENERQKTFYVRQLQDLRADRDALQAKLDQVTLPDQDRIAQLRVAALNATPDNPSRAVGASAWDNTEQRGVLQVDNLPVLPRDRDYQLWLFDPQFAAPISAGTFSVDVNGSVRLQFKAAARIAQAQRFAVSVERKGGAAVPTAGKVVLMSN